MRINIDYEIDFNEDIDLNKVYESIADMASSVLELSDDFKDIDVNIIIMDNESIWEINLAQRGIDAPTDVLSFPMFEFSEICKLPDISEEEAILGDIIISLDRAREQAEEYGHSLKRELGFLFLHGLLHILGFDHETEKERMEMEAYQDKILDNLSIKR